MLQAQKQSKDIKTLEIVSEPLRSMATRLANTQEAIQAAYPGEAENIAAVRAQLALITRAVYDALEIKVPVLHPNKPK